MSTATNMNTKSSGQPSLRLRDVTRMLVSLSRVMIREIDCLKALDIKGIEDLQVDKVRLGADIEMSRLRIESEPELAATFTTEEKEEFRKIKAIYEEVAMENARRIAVAKEVNRQLVDVIRQAVSEASAGFSYTDSGMAATADTNVSMKHDEMV